MLAGSPIPSLCALCLLAMLGACVGDSTVRSESTLRGESEKGEAASTPTPLLASVSLDPHREINEVAFGSCFKAQRGETDIWHSIAATQPDLFLFAGDTLYPRRENERAGLPDLWHGYEMLAAVEPFTQLRLNVPVLAVWDDHDFGMNDGGADFSRRQDAEAHFEAAWIGEREDPRRHRDGIYHSVVLGPPGKRLQLILLDTRFFRSPLTPTDRWGAGRERYIPSDDPAQTMLGNDQWLWLEEQLKQPADLRLLVSSIQVLADGHGWEGWRQLPREQERLFNLLRAHDNVPLVVLSGDRHVAGLYERDIGLSQPLLEFTSSALNNTLSLDNRRSTLSEAGPYRLGDLYGEANFGSLTIDWPARAVRLALRDRRGDVVRALTRELPRRP